MHFINSTKKPTFYTHNLITAVPTRHCTPPSLAIVRTTSFVAPCLVAPAVISASVASRSYRHFLFLFEAIRRLYCIDTMLTYKESFYM